MKHLKAKAPANQAASLKKLSVATLLSVNAYLSVSCQEMTELLKKAEKATLGESYTAPAGEDATAVLAQTYQDEQVDVSSLLEAMRLSDEQAGSGAALAADDDQSPPEVTPGAAEALKAIQKAKLSYRADAFSQIGDSFFAPTAPAFLADQDFSQDNVSWTHADDEFTVSALDKMPVRDQGQRGTCASFAGIGQIEAYLIKHFELGGIDLAEQRFYYMSKPEHWSTGGLADDGGSNLGTGFAKSAGIEHEGVTFPPDSPSDFNIPLETDCPYNPKLGSNDLQTPQASGCKAGVAKVETFKAWVHRWEERPASAQEIFDLLIGSDIPVPVGTRLSANWEDNDGMITLAQAGKVGDSGHAAGHAYLIVGARRLSESQYPNEGGMCFIIKNSWGTGWGVNGLSCMTLAWFNEWRYPYPIDTIDEVVLDTSKFADAKQKATNPPSSIKDPDPAEGDRPQGGEAVTSKVRRGTATISLTDSEAPSSSAMSLVTLTADNALHYKMLYKIEGERIFLRGILATDDMATHAIDLAYRDGKLYLQKSADEEVEVGTLDQSTQTLTLCSRQYGQVCLLNYLATSKELVIGITEQEFARKDSVPPYRWTRVSLGGFGFELSHPEGFNTELDVRLLNKGVPTNPLRFVLKPLTGAISYQGYDIGNLQSFEFCSGSFQATCRVVVSGDTFHIFFKAGAGK